MRAETEVVVSIRPANRGRVTGWSVFCPDHGVMPVLAPGKAAGMLAARRHIESEHFGRGGVEVRHA